MHNFSFYAKILHILPSGLKTDSPLPEILIRGQKNIPRDPFAGARESIVREEMRIYLFSAEVWGRGSLMRLPPSRLPPSRSLPWKA